MTGRSITLTPDLNDYLVANGSRPDEVVTDLIAETHAALPANATMQIAPDQARFMTLLTKIVGVRNAVEVGTFTGLSALAIARGLAPGGRLVCCDVSEEWTAIARRYWRRAGVDDRIELRIGPAAGTLAALPAEPYLDLSFIDADKTGYATYWAEIVPRTRSGGVILVDNVLQSGRVIDPAATDPQTRAIRDFNARVVADERVELVMLPIADGLTLARKR